MDILRSYGIAYLLAVFDLLGDLWPYFIGGFLVAGFIAEFVPTRILTRLFGHNSFAALLRATLAGTVASVCSCGAIPIAVTLRKQGATRASSMTFLLAAPWAGFMQVLLFYRFLGAGRTAVVFVCALLVAFLSGLVLSLLETRGLLDEPVAPETRGAAEKSADPIEVSACDREHAESMRARLVYAFKEAWEAFLELWKYLAVGLLLAGVLKAFVPLPWISRFLGPNAVFNPVLTAVPLAAMVELCSEGFSIFAGQLYSMGATLSVVFVVTMVGVTTDFTELIVIWKKFGRKSAFAYVSIASAFAVGFGFLIQIFQG